MNIPTFDGPGFACFPARYAKGTAVIQISGDGSGFKGTGAWLAEALGGRWSRRNKGYAMAPNRALQWRALYLAGFEPSRRYFFKDRTPYTFERDGRKLTLREALAEVAP
jgi:hypothetical protein